MNSVDCPLNLEREVVKMNAYKQKEALIFFVSEKIKETLRLKVYLCLSSLPF
jgi:hypothetical protein